MTTTELAVHQGGALAITPDQQQWTPQQVAVLRQLGLQDASPADLDIFHHQCQRTGLDPFARQIYMIGRWSREGTKYTIQTSIDGLRLVGHRAASARRETLEVSDTEWCGPDGVWRDVWLSDEPPAAARVAILRNGGRFPAVAMFREYAQTKKDGSLTQMWADKGALMIAKCAEALAWRKAFPHDLSGLYTSDEMDQANNRQAAPAPTPPPAADPAEMIAATLDGEVLVTADQTGQLTALMADLALDKRQMLATVREVTGRAVKSAADLTEVEADLVIADLAARLTPTTEGES